MHGSDDPLRLQLSAMASAGADILPQLRLLMLSEALSASPSHRAFDLSAETCTLCTAANEVVRRRTGWLYIVPSPAPLPVALPRQLWQTAVLCTLRSAQPAGRVIITLQAVTGAAVAMFRVVCPSRIPGDMLPLLHRAAALTGGVCVAAGIQAGPSMTSLPPHFAISLRLPLAPRAPLRKPCTIEVMLHDRYSPLHILLDGFTV